MFKKNTADKTAKKTKKVSSNKNEEKTIPLETQISILNGAIEQNANRISKLERKVF